MTTFEIIILVIIYMFCYGYITALFKKEENIWLITFLAIVSLVLAVYAPLLFGRMLYDKLNKN